MTDLLCYAIYDEFVVETACKELWIHTHATITSPVLVLSVIVLLSYLVISAIPAPARKLPRGRLVSLIDLQARQLALPKHYKRFKFIFLPAALNR